MYIYGVCGGHVAIFSGYSTLCGRVRLLFIVAMLYGGVTHQELEPECSDYKIARQEEKRACRTGKNQPEAML